MRLVSVYKMEKLSDLEEKFDKKQKIVEETQKALGELTDINTENKTILNDLKSDSAASKKLIAELGRKVGILEETMALTQENVTPNSAFLVNKLNSMDKQGSEILTQVKCVASQQVESV